MKLEQAQFVRAAYTAALKSHHIFPDFAACEAALESAYGASQLARDDNNLFGMKQHRHPVFGTHSLPTREFQNGQWIVVTADWVHYPSWDDCFADRMATLARLASAIPHYAAALAAITGADYVHEVSRSWSTDPGRAEKVIEIYSGMAGLWK